MPTSLNITYGGEQLVLNYDKTLWWPARHILFATDLHAGKASHMQHHGLAIPNGSLEYDLQLLTQAIARHAARRLIFLGDLFHSETNSEWEVFSSWCLAQACPVELVRGNHDRFLSDEQLLAAGLIVHNEPYQEGPFELRHHPRDGAGPPVLCGHVHPVLRTHGPAHDRLRLPCFWQQPNQLVLPAFGSLTGGYDVRRAGGERAYVCAENAIVRVY